MNSPVQMKTINPYEGQIVTVFQPLGDGHSVEAVLCEHQNVSMQRAADGTMYSLGWNDFGDGIESSLFRHRFGLLMDYRPQA